MPWQHTRSSSNVRSCSRTAKPRLVARRKTCSRSCRSHRVAPTKTRAYPAHQHQTSRNATVGWTEHGEAQQCGTCALSFAELSPTYRSTGTSLQLERVRVHPRRKLFAKRSECCRIERDRDGLLLGAEIDHRLAKAIQHSAVA